jgi:hypothetical protein
MKRRIALDVGQHEKVRVVDNTRAAPATCGDTEARVEEGVDTKNALAEASRHAEEAAARLSSTLSPAGSTAAVPLSLERCIRARALQSFLADLLKDQSEYQHQVDSGPLDAVPAAAIERAALRFIASLQGEASGTVEEEHALSLRLQEEQDEQEEGQIVPESHLAEADMDLEADEGGAAPSLLQGGAPPLSQDPAAAGADYYYAAYEYGSYWPSTDVHAAGTGVCLLWGGTAFGISPLQFPAWPLKKERMMHAEGALLPPEMISVRLSDGQCCAYVSNLFC